MQPNQVSQAPRPVTWPFDLSGLTPHGFCLAWDSGLIWLTAGSNLLIAAAYFSIPAALLVVLRRRRHFGYPGLLLLFAGFILACGTTHVFDVVLLWLPLYWFGGAIDALTAVLSVATAILLWPLIPKLVALPSPAVLQSANLRLQEAERATAVANRWLAMSEQLSHVGHWRQNRPDAALAWSDEMFRIFGFENRGSDVTAAAMDAGWHPEDHATIAAAAAAAFRDQTGFDAAVRVVRPSGEIRHVRLRCEVQRGPDGKTACLFGTCADRTEQETVERELESARAEADAMKRLAEEQALVDMLTGLPNRRRFDAALDGEFRRARRAGTVLAVMMIDVDHFKAFNDWYGHVSGDNALRAIARAVPVPLRRPGDLAARFGGEEFAVILPGADLMVAATIAQRIVELVRDLAIAHEHSPSRVVTISVGVAAMVPGPEDGDPTPLLEQADRALYAAKRQGRNQVHLSHPDDPVPQYMPRLSRPNDEPGAALVMATPARRWTRTVAPGREGGSPGGTPNGSPITSSGGTAASPVLDLHAVIDALPYGLVLTDATQPDNPIVLANPAFVALTGHRLEALLGRNCRMLQGPDTDRDVVAALGEAIHEGVPIRRVVLNYREDGTTFWNELHLVPRRDAAGAVLGFIGTQRDITEVRLAHEAKALSEARLERIVENLPGYIFQRACNADGRFSFSYFSASYWRTLGYPDVPPLETMDAFQHVHPDDAARVCRAVEHSVRTRSAASIEFRAIGVDGEQFWMRTHATPRTLENGDVVWDGVGIDVTLEKAASVELEFLAHHDPLTGLYNRPSFKQSMARAIEAAAAAGTAIVVFAVDLDGLQEINDALGPAAGDAVLTCMGERLAAFCSPDGAAGRLGGDEFSLYRPEGPSSLDSAEVLCRMLSRPMQVEGHDIGIQACVGAAVTPRGEAGTDAGREKGRVGGAEDAADEMIKRCNLALSEAKRAGRGSWRGYTAEMGDTEQRRGVLRRSLHRDSIETQFMMLYHPLVDLATGGIVGAEALLRWNHPDLGPQRPDLFIPMAETSGLIVPLGAWVFRTAMQELRRWGESGSRSRTVRMSVNVSSIQIRDPGFIAMIDATMAETGADPRLVDIELTESVLIEPTGPTIAILDLLRERGFRLAMDDFGTGYSSFRCLRDLPIDEIKIDQTFVRRTALGRDDDAIVEAIMTVAKRLGLLVVAEGIETPVQRDFVRDEGCAVGQGYLFSLPLTAQDFRRLLEDRSTLPIGEVYAGVSQAARPIPSM